MSEEVDLVGNHTLYNPLHTTKFKSPPNLDEMRKNDPQGAIDYLWSRKEMYKSIAKKNHQLLELKIKEYEDKIAEVELKSKKVIHKFKEEKAMKLWWQKTAYISGIIIISLLILLAMSFIDSRKVSKMPVSGMIQKTPNHVLASVNIYNGEVQGSGTVISQGEKFSALLSAAHNFKGVIDGEFWVYYPDGTYTKAKLLAIDRERDLVVAKVDSSTILAHSYIPNKIVDGEISGVGYTGGQGPNYRKLVYNKSYYNDKNKYMWEFGVENGPFWDGDSGGGVFIDEALVGVTSQRDALVFQGNGYIKRLYACSHDEIVRFLEENKEKLSDCGDWSQAAVTQVVSSDLPPIWMPKPNIPIYTENRLEKSFYELKLDIEEIKKRIGYKGDGLKKPSEIK